MPGPNCHMTHNVDSNKRYWEDFYRAHILSVPSQFCAMVATEIPSRSTIVELGCGNGRDSLYFASQRHTVRAVDLAHEAIKICTDSARTNGLENIEFMQGDLCSDRDVGELFARARDASQDGSVIAYSRFVVHSIDDAQEGVFLRAVAAQMRSGERIYFEFRSKEDEGLEKTFGNHYRRFVDTDAFVNAQVGEHGFRLEYRLTGRGMAKYKSEDPFVSRLVFEKS